MLGGVGYVDRREWPDSVPFFCWTGDESETELKDATEGYSEEPAMSPRASQGHCSSFFVSRRGKLLQYTSVLSRRGIDI